MKRSKVRSLTLAEGVNKNVFIPYFGNRRTDCGVTLS